MGIYLNNAATSWPKPAEVAEAMSKFLLQSGANLARGANSERDLETLNFVLDCRFKLAEFFNGYEDQDPRYITFCANITEALNIVLRGYLKPGMKVLTSSMEHNAVMRPLRFLEQQGVILKVLPCEPDGFLKPEVLEQELKFNKYDLMVMSHASNVSGTVQDIERIAEICKLNKLNLVLDTAQTAGVLKLDVNKLNLAALCFTGHKGLMGPQGTGGIVWRPDFAAEVTPIISGGTGSFSHLEYQPEDLPDKFESGT
ncbi:MAG: aminotransferase class V-fold PLP-dependent enzyme, partial [Synergistaceae bacterium]|nr:aminotransferase class V-fold PLP-dependent enzyme [Synergistaceae bacterium]